MSSQPWKCALVTGGGGGLGKAFAQSLIQRGKKVYLAGRTESNLAATAKEIGAAGYFVVDVGNITSLSTFVDKVTKTAPEVDCIINNAGIQKPLEFGDGVDLSVVDQEININIVGVVHLCALFIPHLKQKKHACIMNVSSGLGFVPASYIPIYSASKAFIHSFTLSLREQLRLARISVVELVPPLVESDLHRNHEGTAYEAGIKSGKLVALSQEEWMAAVHKGWDQGDEEIGAALGTLVVTKWRGAFGQLHAQMNKA